MNIFYLDPDPKVSAQSMTNKHVVKMILESAQLMSTAHHVLDGENTKLYKKTHVNHPSAVWVRQSILHYKWLYEHYLALCDEYILRYNKVHKTDKDLSIILSYAPKNIDEKTQFSEPPQAMPVQYHDDSSVSAYRHYYNKEKLKLEEDIERFKRILL
jgi:hypothetical protein